MILPLDSLEDEDGKGSFSLHLIVFVQDITCASSPSLLSADERAIEYGGRGNVFGRESQYAGRGRAMMGGRNDDAEGRDSLGIVR